MLKRFYGKSVCLASTRNFLAIMKLNFFNNVDRPTVYFQYAYEKNFTF